MNKVIVFNSDMLDGFFTDTKGDMSWAHRAANAEWNDFVKNNSRATV